MQLWIVGRIRSAQNPENAWELMGVFDTHENASIAATESLDFIAPITLNVRQSEEPSEFANMEWPNIHEWHGTQSTASE